MKLILIAAVSVLATSAKEHPRSSLIQLCGAELARAVRQVCQDGDLDFFNLQHVQRHHEHNHYHEGQEGQEGQEGHEGHKGHEGHDWHVWKGHVTKRDAPYSLVDECCAKPCHVKDFATYCP